jgi:hypothetical protein
LLCESAAEATAGLDAVPLASICAVATSGHKTNTPHAAINRRFIAILLQIFPQGHTA